VFELEQDESRAGDAGDGGGVGADSAQGLEGDLEQGVGAFGDTVYAPDDLVERLLVLGELAALWLLDRVAEAGACRTRSGPSNANSVRPSTSAEPGPSDSPRPAMLWWARLAGP
jgi:hypothetical protein